MKLFDKIKDIFTEETEEEIAEPIKKEVIKVEIASPVGEEKESISDNELLQENKEEKISFPVFDDADFKDEDYAIKEPDISSNTARVELYSKSKEESKAVLYRDENKLFVPSPIISPVYGILDKNYQKEDIRNKKANPSDIKRKTPEIDEIRKKAFSTLENDLEEIMETNEYKFDLTLEDMDNLEEEVDLFEEMTQTLDVETNTEEKEMTIAEKIEQVENEDLGHTLEQLIGDNNENFGETNEEENEDNLTEDDLFDLIDSMYEKGEE